LVCCHRIFRIFHRAGGTRGYSTGVNGSPSKGIRFKPTDLLASVDLFTVPTVRFQVLYVFLVLAHDRRRILHFGVTAHPTAE
jgi:hypothetical protein